MIHTTLRYRSKIGPEGPPPPPPTPCYMQRHLIQICQCCQGRRGHVNFSWIFQYCIHRIIQRSSPPYTCPQGPLTTRTWRSWRRDNSSLDFMGWVGGVVDPPPLPPPNLWRRVEGRVRRKIGSRGRSLIYNMVGVRRRDEYTE